MNLQPEPGTPEWGTFRRPLFNDPSARALSRVGVVDVGSNSVRMVVFDGAARSPAYFYNEKIMCALGEGLAETGRLNPQGRVRALAALNRFQHIARGLDLAPLTAVATAAVRDAEDGQEFCDQVERETGLKVWVIDGEEEARLSAQGVLLGWPGAYGLVCDMGGASMELAEIDGNRVGKCMTSSLGPQGGDQDHRRGHAREDGQTARPSVPGRRQLARHRPHRHGAARLSDDGSARIPDDGGIGTRHHALHRNHRARKAAGQGRGVGGADGAGADRHRRAAPAGAHLPAA
jgi:hypothetical protein